MSKPLVLRPRQCIDLASKDVLLADLRRVQAHVVEFRGDGIVDEASFFRQAATDLPQPSDRLASDWNALADNLYEELFGITAGKIVIVWSSPYDLYNSDLELFLLALGVLEEALVDWASRGTTGRRGCVVFVGKGKGFLRRRP